MSRSEVLVSSDWLADNADTADIPPVAPAEPGPVGPELTALDNVGVTPDRLVTAYCRNGERSSHTWFVPHELLEYPNVRNHDGSWTEYGSLFGVPVER
jgi:hypothetical protein